MEKKNVVKKLATIFLIFMIGSVIGYIVEMIVCLVQKGYFESRQGLLYGPFTPVYGIGIIIYYIAFNFIKTRDKKKVFLITMLIGGIIEYLLSFLQEKIFGTVSWDYSNWIFNINGRTTLIHCTYWGIAGILYVTYIEPLIPRFEELFEKNSVKIITCCVAFLMFFNISLSTMAGIRQKERANGIPAGSRFETFLDKKYPDSYMDKVFANKKLI